MTATIRSARETVIERITVSRLGKSIMRETDRDILALREARAALEAADAAIAEVLSLVGDIGPEARRILTAVRGPMHLCPECVQGKHSNCVEQTLDDNDQWVPCGCPEHGEAP